MLSYIVPVFKPDMVALEKCIRALIAQALTDWELVVVFDGPEPAAKSLIARLMKKSPNHFKMVEIEHGGACKARNEGFKHSKGELVVFWDCDSVIEPGASTMWVNTFAKRPEVGFIYSGYKFFGDKYAIDSEQFDPYTLRIRNYISTCFPLRRELFPGWGEGLKSLQDWDFWLSVVEKAEKEGKDVSKLGFFVRGYAFSTPMPTANSISGQGCTPEVWLERMDAVKARHGLVDNPVCVTGLDYKHEGVKLAKLIGADYLDNVADKPNRYKTIIQIGFSTDVNKVEQASSAFQNKDQKKILFWTGDNISEMYNTTSVKAMLAYRELLNTSVTQYVDDKAAYDALTMIGFHVEIMPLPLENHFEPAPMPEKPKWAVDISGGYGKLLGQIDVSLPDFELEVVSGQHPINDYVGVIHFFQDRGISQTVKRAHLAGRHVISNIQQPFCGYVDDTKDGCKFVENVVAKVRELKGKEPPKDALSYYKNALSKDKLMEVIA